MAAKKYEKNKRGSGISAPGFAVGYIQKRIELKNIPIIFCGMLQKVGLFCIIYSNRK